MECKDVRFSVDLVEAALNHLRFLDYVDNFESVLTEEVLQHGVRRYEQLWLPLAGQHRDVKVVAPVDVAWFWYLHMLQPLSYRRDCRKLLKSTLDHQFPDEKNLIPQTNNAIEMWYATYNKEGFNIIRSGEYVRPRRNAGQVKTDKRSKLSVDLIANARSHIHFCYQVALPHFRDIKYLENALVRYKQFLCLKKLDPEAFLTPSVDILLMWYTHMCYPLAYATDMMNICGKILDNNIKVKPGKIDERFIQAREKTNELWKKVSNEELLKPGTKLRSDDGRREVLPVTLTDLKGFCVTVYKLHLTNAEIQNLSKKHKHFNLQILRVNKDGSREEVVALDGPRHMWSFSKSFDYNTVEHKEFRVVLNSHGKLVCFGSQTLLAEGVIDMRTEMDCLLPNERALSIGTTLAYVDGHALTELSLGLDGAVDGPTPVLCDLTLRRDSFTMARISGKTLQQNWGRASVESSMDDLVCYTALHKLVNHEGKDTFTCRVSHVPEVLHSGVEVLLNNKLVASARLIGSSQLPHSAQVSEPEMTMSFDPELGERAMLIRCHAGDWGLCVARWRKGSGGEGDGLDVRFMRLTDQGKVKHVRVTSADLEFQSLTGSMYSGKLLVNPAANTVAENVALFWSVCVLHVLCRPGDDVCQIAVHPQDSQPTPAKANEEADTNEDITQVTKLPKVVYVSENQCEFLIASGITTDTPCNAYLRQKFGSLTCDLLLDADDVIVEEQKTNERLSRKESVITLDNIDGVTSGVKKRRKKKRLSDLSTTTVSEKVPEDITVQANSVAQINATNDEGETQKTKPVNVVKPKIKKRKTSKLEDMLAMSDDSITKDDVTEVKLVKEGRHKVIVRKVTSNLSETSKPPEDSLDEEEKEIKEFFAHTEEKVENSDLLDVQTMAKETTMIKEKANKIKQEFIETASVTGLPEVETDRLKGITFHLGEPGDTPATVTSEDQRSDTSSIASSITQEKRRLRKKISHEREVMYPLTDEDADDRKARRKTRNRKPRASRMAEEPLPEVAQA